MSKNYTINYELVHPSRCDVPSSLRDLHLPLVLYDCQFPELPNIAKRCAGRF